MKTRKKARRAQRQANPLGGSPKPIFIVLAFIGAVAVASKFI